MIIYDLLQWICCEECQPIQIFSIDGGNILYEGTAAEMPEHFEAREILSIEAASVDDMGVLVVNVE